MCPSRQQISRDLEPTGQAFRNLGGWIMNADSDPHSYQCHIQLVWLSSCCGVSAEAILRSDRRLSRRVSLKVMYDSLMQFWLFQFDCIHFQATLCIDVIFIIEKNVQYIEWKLWYAYAYVYMCLHMRVMLFTVLTTTSLNTVLSHTCVLYGDVS